MTLRDTRRRRETERQEGERAKRGFTTVHLPHTREETCEGQQTLTVAPADD